TIDAVERRPALITVPLHLPTPRQYATDTMTLMRRSTDLREEGPPPYPVQGVHKSVDVRVLLIGELEEAGARHREEGAHQLLGVRIPGAALLNLLFHACEHAVLRRPSELLPGTGGARIAFSRLLKRPQRPAMFHV